MNSHSRRGCELWWLVPVLLVAVYLRVHRLTDISFWFDEAFCLKMAEFSPLEIVDRALVDPHPPLFYFVLKAWIGIFGSSVTAVRLLGVSCGLVTISGIFLFVLEACRNDESGHPDSSTFTAVLATTFIALSPSHITWSLLVRMYSLGTALAAFSSYFLMRAIRRGSTSHLDWALFTSTAIFMLYTHYFGLFTVVAEYMFAFGYAWIPRLPKIDTGATDCRRPLAISALCAYVASLPWQIPFLQHRQLVAEQFQIPPLTFDVAAATIYSMLDLHLWQEVTPVRGFIAIQACFLVVLLTLLGRRRTDFYLAFASGLPLVSATVVSLLMRHIFVARYFLFVQMFLLVSAAALVARIPCKRVRICTALVTMAAMGFLGWQQYQKMERDARLPGMRGAIAFLDSQRRPGEILVVCNPMLYLPAIFHTQNRRGTYAQGSAQIYPFYQGTAVMRDDEYISLGEIVKNATRHLWTLDADRWFNQTWKVPVPPGWKKEREIRFQEFNAEIVLRFYAREAVESDDEFGGNPTK